MKLTGINQLWVADITYIWLKAEFVYLAVSLDGFSRKVVGWALDRTLAMRLTIGALEQAIESRQPEPGLVHHSDRGLQYASEEYIKVLENNRVIPSMSRPTNPVLRKNSMRRISKFLVFATFVTSFQRTCMSPWQIR
jgi:transposase InsO family protein